MTSEPISVREHLETLHREYVAAHQREHIVHEQAHGREHQLNKDAIDKAEQSVGKAVEAARETIDTSIDGLSDRIESAARERRRELDDMREMIRQMGLSVATIQTKAEGNLKSIQAIQDTQTWIVRLVVGAIILAVLALIFRPGVI